MPEFELVLVDCPVCGGSKACPTCGGAGQTSPPGSPSDDPFPTFSGSGFKKRGCPSCGGKGVCSKCNGTGQAQYPRVVFGS